MVKSVSSDTIKKIARSGPESQVSWKRVSFNFLMKVLDRFIGREAIFGQLSKNNFVLTLI